MYIEELINGILQTNMLTSQNFDPNATYYMHSNDEYILYTIPLTEEMFYYIFKETLASY